MALKLRVTSYRGPGLSKSHLQRPFLVWCLQITEETNLLNCQECEGPSCFLFNYCCFLMFFDVVLMFFDVLYRHESWMRPTNIGWILGDATV